MPPRPKRVRDAETLWIDEYAETTCRLNPAFGMRRRGCVKPGSASSRSEMSCAAAMSSSPTNLIVQVHGG